MVCPHCGADQLESPFAQSTICLTCSRHFKVEPESDNGSGSIFAFWKRFGKSIGKGDKASLSPFAPSVSGPGTPPATPALRTLGQIEPFYGSSEYVASPQDEERRFKTRSADLDEMLFGEVDTEGDEHEMIEVEPLSTAPHSMGDGVYGSKVTTTSVPERTVRCVDCNEVLRVSKHASSTICKSCSTYISLRDFDIRDHRMEDIKTRGSITIQKRASLTATRIASENLRMYGKISGKINCSGTAFFRARGKVVGSVECRHLLIHKLCNLQFVPGIRAETAEIHGRVEGDIICEGTIVISKTGAVIGDCIAPAVKLEDGGILSGRMRIMKPDSDLEKEYLRKAEEARMEYFQNQLEADLEAFRIASEADDGEDDDEEDGFVPESLAGVEAEGDEPEAVVKFEPEPEPKPNPEQVAKAEAEPLAKPEAEPLAGTGKKEEPQDEVTQHPASQAASKS